MLQGWCRAFERSAAGNQGLPVFGLNVRLGEFLIAWLIVLGLVLYPVWHNHYVSINDLVNHLAREWVLFHYAQVQSLQHFYAPNWKPFPDLALDIFAQLVAPLLPWMVTAKLFITAILLLQLSGVVALHHALFRKWSVWPLCAALLIYNRPLLFGFVNYLFAIGIYLHATAFWVTHREGRAALRIAGTTAFAVLLCFAHLLSVGVLGLTLGGYELARLLRQKTPPAAMARTLAQLFLPFILPALIVVFVMPHNGEASDIQWGSLVSRITAFGAPILYWPLADVAIFAVLGGFLAWALRARLLSVDCDMAGAVGVLCIVQMLMPTKLFTGFGIDQRIPVALLMLAVASTDLTVKSRQLSLAVCALLVAAIGVKIAAVDQRWNMEAAVYHRIESAMTAIPEGAKVAMAYPHSQIDSATAPAIAGKDLVIWEIVARGGFSPDLFAHPTQHPLKFLPAFRKLSFTLPLDYWQWLTGDNFDAAGDAKVTAVLHKYDYLVALGDLPRDIRHGEMFTLVRDEPYVKIFRRNP